ncbi:hypothetical protein K9M41_04595 [Candidatus Gracilibacteria bacterium]|nr:hypothetical protein [Candidatus Gracilibacteria bacterium]
MRVVLLTTNYYLAANTAVKAFLQNTLRKKYDIQVVGIIGTTMLPFNKYSWRQMRRFLKQAGIKFFLKSIITNFWRHLCIQFAKYCIPDKNRDFFEVEELAEKNHVSFLSVENINSPEAREFIRSKNPDYLVSCLLLQVLKKPVLDLPLEGAINFHPALFQDHRGTFSGFWALLKNLKRSGATVHFMTEKLDNGKVVLQRPFFVRPSDTIYCLDQRSARLGGNLLVKALVKLKKKKAKTFWIKKMSQVFTMPTQKEVAIFEKRGKKIIKWRDFFRV